MIRICGYTDGVARWRSTLTPEGHLDRKETFALTGGMVFLKSDLRAP
jgi:hypothetical protein